MSITTRTVSPDEAEVFFKTMGVSFAFDSTPEDNERAKEFFPWDRMWAAYDDGQMIATFGAFELDMTVPGGSSLKTGGTTVVTVLATHRRRGVMRGLMIDHLHQLHEWDEPLAALWASESAIYGRFGYGPAADLHDLEIERRSAQLRNPPDIVGRVRLIDPDEAQEILPGVYDRVVKERPGMFRRSESWWEHRILHDPPHRRRGKSSRRIAVLDDPAVGYVAYRQEGFDPQTLHLIELFGVTPDDEKALWEYLFGVDLVGPIKAWNRPTDELLRWWLVDPRKAKLKQQDALWLRVLDVEKSLNGRRYRGTGRIVFSIQDELCPWNDGTYRLDIEDGHPTCSRTDAAPDLHLDPWSLGSIYLGGQSVKTLWRSGRISGSADGAALADQLFSWNVAPWVQEVF